MQEREKLRSFRGGNLEVKLTLHRTPSLWEERRFYLGHLISVQLVESRRQVFGDEGIEFDSRRANAVLYDFGKGGILVDPGFMGFYDPGARLKHLIGDKKIVATLVSHGHYDHWQELGSSKGSVYMTRLAFRLASRHASMGGNDETVEALGRARMVIPGEPILMNALPVRIETFSLPHSVPETMGFVIKGQRKRVVHLGDFRFNGMTSGPKFATINRLQEIAKEPVDLVAMTIFNAHIDGFAPIEDLAVGSVADIIRQSNRTIIACFSTNLRRIERLAVRARLLGRQVQFIGTGMQNAREFIELEAGLGDPERAVIFVTGCQAEEGSALWRIANNQNPSLELCQDDTLIFSSRCIPGNEDKLRQLYSQLRPQVGRLVVTRGEVNHLGLHELGLEESLTHVSGHENREGLRLALEILRPKKVLAWPQVSPQIDAFRDICEELGVELLDESERVIEI
jgi:ribonuclease J